jgi:hypothetical protein
VSNRLPRLRGAEPLDLRIVAVFVVLTLALVAPGIAHALSPLDEQGVQDAASGLESSAREAVALIDHRDATTALTFSAELQDLAGEAQAARDDLRHQAVEPGAAQQRDQLADIAGTFADAAADASLAIDDRARLAKSRSALQKVVDDLQRLGGGS